MPPAFLFLSIPTFLWPSQLDIFPSTESVRGKKKNPENKLNQIVPEADVSLKLKVYNPASVFKTKVLLLHKE